MLEIMTIGDFMNLPMQQQQEIQKALRVKDRLENWLKSLNKPDAQQQAKQAYWRPCKFCSKTATPGRCVVCNPDHPGWELVEPRDNSDIHPSQITKCLKNLWFCCSGYAEQLEEYIDPRLQMIFDLGHSWHHTVQSYGLRGAWCEKQYYKPEEPIDPDELVNGHPKLPVAHEFWIKGSVDAIIDRYIVHGVPTIGDVAVRMVHEYKTINNAGFTNLNRPKPEHKQQATIYSKVFDAPFVVFHYTNKDNCNHIDYPVAFDQLVWNAIHEKIKRVQFYVESGSPPPWSETSAVKNPSECKKCGYFKICKPPGV